MKGCGFKCRCGGRGQSGSRAVLRVFIPGNRSKSEASGKRASGDRADNVARLAARYGIEDWHGGLDPAAKLALLEANDPEHTLMIGDGINDAPVLARASVSVAVGRANPLSQTHADIVLLKNGPEALPYLLELAARSRRITRQNLAWATVYNLTILPLAISGHLTPWIAALGMSASSLLVIANALRIHRTTPPPAE